MTISIIDNLCTLASDQINNFYDEDSKTWILTDEIIKNDLNDDIQMIVNCVNRGDTIMFDTNDVIKPISTIVITREDLTFSYYIKDTILKDGIFPESKAKMKFTCPDDAALFDIKYIQFLLN